VISYTSHFSEHLFTY